MAFFSQPVHRHDVEHGPKIFTLVADMAVRKALADRFGLLSVESLEGHVEVIHLPDGLRVKGHMTASVVQACVVSLKPVPARIEDSFSIHYVIGPLTEEQEESVLDADAEDIEELKDEQVDVVEVLAQTLALALDPYPRADGVDLPAGVGTEEEQARAARRESPFAILKNLADKT